MFRMLPTTMDWSKAIYLQLLKVYVGFKRVCNAPVHKYWINGTFIDKLFSWNYNRHCTYVIQSFESLNSKLIIFLTFFQHPIGICWKDNTVQTILSDQNNCYAGYKTWNNFCVPYMERILWMYPSSGVRWRFQMSNAQSPQNFSLHDTWTISIRSVMLEIDFSAEPYKRRQVSYIIRSVEIETHNDGKSIVRRTICLCTFFIFRMLVNSEFEYLRQNYGK